MEVIWVRITSRYGNFQNHNKNENFLTVGDIELYETVAGWQGHLIKVCRVPRAHDHPPCCRYKKLSIKQLTYLTDRSCSLAKRLEDVHETKLCTE